MEEVADIGPTIAATVIGGIIATGVTGIIITAVGCGERSEAKSKWGRSYSVSKDCVL